MILGEMGIPKDYHAFIWREKMIYCTNREAKFG
jgi:hypothetical protein